MASTRPDSFYALGVRPKLAAALAERGIAEPFPIQAESLPDSLAGRDVLGKGRTGSGKTVAFALPLIERVLAAGGRRAPRRPRALVLVPTRELAVQVQDTIEYLAKAVKLKSMTVFGGVRYTGQLRKLEHGVDIVVATPGRLEDLLEQGALHLDDMTVVVLDEADMMADMGFLPPVRRVLGACPPGQRLLFSATLDRQVSALVDEFLHDPLVHAVEDAEAAPDAQHYLFLVRNDNKSLVVRELLSGGGRALAFTRTKHGAERLARTLTAAGIPAVDLHGNLRQGARQRNLAAFADGSISVLVATDIAARGIHVDEVGLVLHVDPPAEHKAFLHRSGRTARAGAEGTVVTLATKNQNHAVRALMAQAKIRPIQVVVAPGDAILTEVRAPKVEAVAAGTSIFEPDPDDAAGSEALPARRSADARPRRPDRPRPDEGRRGRESRDPGIPGRRRPEHGERSPRADRDARRDSARPTARGGHDQRQLRRGEWTSEWWGPEPWEVEDAPRGRGQRDGRRGAPAPRDKARPARAWGAEERDGRRPAEGRDERRPRPGRDSQREAEGSAASRRKERWSDDDRRRAAESRERGFGFRKQGGPAKGGKKAADKDKGKRRKPR